MDRERLIDAALTSLLLLLIGFVVIAMSGCLSVSLIGGRHQNVTNIGSDDNDSSPDMEAPSDTRIKDVLKDLFPTGIPDLPIVIPGDLPPDAGGKSPPATNNPPPVVPDEPVSGDAGGDQTFLWKPKYSPVKPAESGSGVALLPAAIPDPVSAELRVGGESIPASNISRNGHNGNRAHIRFEAEYPRGPGELITLFESGDARSWPIEDTHRRTY